MKNVLFLLFVLLFFLGGSEKVDIKTEIESVRKADSAWLQALSDKDIDRLILSYEDDAMWLLPNEPTIKGKDAIRKRFLRWFEVPGSFITWKPIRIEVSISRDLAYSLGTFEARYNNLDSEIVK